MSSTDLPALLPVPLAAQLLGLKRASAYRYAARANFRRSALVAAYT
ncbi:hypothetical protein [Fodinicola feengrottensis]|nr:hypothetical protein [Fodinicola feengrottensis]